MASVIHMFIDIVLFLFLSINMLGVETFRLFCKSFCSFSLNDIFYIKINFFWSLAYFYATKPILHEDPIERLGIMNIKVFKLQALAYFIVIGDFR